jgi:tetratricopeptide (TPR) repeat protein
MRRTAVVLAFGLVTMASVWALHVTREILKVPMPRLVENIERQLREKPENVELHLNLARLYAMAYALKVTEYDGVVVGPERLEAWFGYSPGTMPGPTRPAPSREHQERAQADLARAVKKYSEVLRLAPDNFIARLGHAWTLEQSGDKTGAIADYRKVVELAWPIDSQQSGFFNDPATAEAAARLFELLDPTKDTREIESLRQKVAEIGKKGRMITPISIPLLPADRPPLDLSARVLFDADGSGILKRWTWIEKDAGWLVYDADGTGEITSALDWFGSVTFWLFWSNGYEALRALDDNGDGELRGTELRKLAIWRDGNQNGVSEKGEVSPLAAHGIAALSCAYQQGDGVDVAAYSARGVVLGDGTTRPSYDVILRSVGRPVTLTAPEQGTLR